MKRVENVFRFEKVILFIVLGIFLISITSALTCSPSTLSTTYTSGESKQISTICQDSNINNLSIGKSGDYFIISETIYSSDSKNITIYFSSSAPIGIHSGSINIGGSPIVPIIFSVEEGVDPNSCHLNPSLASYTQQVQQGSKIPIQKVIFSPTNCGGEIVYDESHIYIEGGIISGGIRKPITITSIVSDGINLEINTEGLNSQTYTSTLKINAFNKIFTIPFTIIVTAGQSPVQNFSVDNLPTCSLTNNILHLNSTYSMVCSNLQPDISIIPKIDTEYIQGTGVDTSSNQYIWYFKPKKMGNTFIKSEFYYLNSPIGDPFSQEVKITSTSENVGGTELKLLFTPSLDVLADGEQTIIQLIDNKTGSLVSSPEIYINAIRLNSLNNSENSFPYILNLGKNYEIRGKAAGYNDLVQIVNITNQKTLGIVLSPDKSNYYIGETITFNSSVEGVSFLIDNTIVNSPYTFYFTGNFLLEAKKEGYITYQKNITILNSIGYTSFNKDFDEWKKGDDIIVNLDKDTSWSVNFYEEKNKTISSEFVAINSGVSSQVSFKIDKPGKYVIIAEGVEILSKTIEGSSFSDFWKKYWGYVISVIALLIVIVVVIFIIKRNSGEDEEIPMDNDFGDTYETSSTSDFE